MLENISYIGIGSNLGDRLLNINKSVRYLDSNKRITVKKVSHIYETFPQGGPKIQPKYLNAVAKIKTSLSPLDLLEQIKIIEKKLKRNTAVRWGPRTIDLDILFYNDLIFINDKLVIPHPLLHKRIFVLKPLCDIAADFIHPLYEKKVKTLLKENATKDEKTIIAFLKK